ncbi:MAG: hypothetical protein ACYDDB_06295, partial [bacterium]
ALPSTNTYNAALNDGISAANTSVSLSNTLTDINYNSNPQSFTMPQTFQVPVTNGYYNSSGTYVSSSYEYNYAFPTSATQSDTLVLQASPNNLTITDANGNTYYGTMSYAFTGDASGHNTVDVGYNASGYNLVNYLADAANFQTLDFNYNGTNNTSLTLNLAQINSGFNNFVLDNSGVANNFTFNNATNNDTFIIQANPNSLTINDATNNSIANVIMDGANIWTGGLSFFGSTINIDSAGTTANAIDGIDFTNNAVNESGSSMTLNITGSQNLAITAGSYNYGFSNYDTGLNDGSTLNINDNSTGILTFDFYNTSSSTNPNGVTINASGSSATLNIHDLSSDNAPNSIILGSGTDAVWTDNGNSIITVGAGTDTIVTYADISNIVNNTNNEPINYTGFIITVQGSINANDSITFTGSGNPGNMPSSVSIDSFSQLNESSAASQSQAIAMALNTLNNKTGGGTDNAAWFQYSGNTYIVNDYQLQQWWNSGAPNDQAVKLVGTIDLSNVTVSGHTISNL